MSQGANRTMPCRNGCGKNIYFDQAKKSATGKPIPLEADTGQPHNCPKSAYNLNKNAGQSKIGNESITDVISKLKADVEKLDKRLADIEVKVNFGG